jgi:sigma-E factor negative regulatory protein RseB
VATGTALIVFAAFAAGVAVADPSSDVPADQALRAAGRAAAEKSFLGVLQMQWTEAGQARSESMLVEGASGSVVVRGGSAAMASPSQRLVQHDGKWDLLWPVPLGGPERPSPAVKYEVLNAGSATVAGRPARVVEFRDGGALLERLFLDLDTNLLLRREQFDGGPTASRSIGFETVTIGSANVAPRVPQKIVDAAASPVLAGHLPTGVSAPVNLPDSYQRLGVYRRSGVTQVLYSDGLYDLSVFEEEGRLDRSQLPHGQRVQIGGRTGFHYLWPGGHVVVWEARGVVHTAVSDAPVAQVLAAVQSIPVTGGSASLLRRLRQVCRALVQPLS